jgi:hypothetical protein
VPAFARVTATMFVLAAASAHAQRTPVCDLAAEDANDEIAVRPADGAEQVARNAPILARYAEGTDLRALQRVVDRDADADCRGQLICLFAERSGDDDGTRARRVAVPGTTETLDARSVRFEPERGLAADSRHFALVARPGFDSASRTELEFSTGSEIDVEPPELAASADGFELDVEPPPAECKAPAGSLRVRLEMPGARDDGDADSVELSLFLTRAAGLREPELRARAPNNADGSVVLAFTLGPGEAADEVCVAVEAVDGTGKRAEDEPELCFNPSAARRSQFASLCAVPRGGALAHAAADNGRGLLIASAFLIAALGWRRTRGPRPRQRASNGAAPALRGGAASERP